MTEISIIDYGMGNLLSVYRAFEYCGGTPKLISDPDALLTSGPVVLPGVGAFGNGMLELRKRGLDQALTEILQQGRPLLGICLGMQLFMDDSQEFGCHKGLGFIPGQVTPLPKTEFSGNPIKVPNVGWSALLLPKGGVKTWHGTLLVDINVGDFMYFVHSFAVVPAESAHVLAEFDFHGLRICAAVQYENVIGCQFHPEKSGKQGLKIIAKFLETSQSLHKVIA